MFFFGTNRQICSYTTVTLSKTPPSSKLRWAKSIPVFQTKTVQKPSPWGGTYLYGLYTVVLPPPPHPQGKAAMSRQPWQNLTVAGLAQSVERLTAEREVAGSIPGAGPLLRVLKWLRNEGTSFALQAARPSRGSDDHVKWRSRLH